MLTGIGFLAIFGIMFCIGGWYGGLFMILLVAGYYGFWILFGYGVDWYMGSDYVLSKEYKESQKEFERKYHELIDKCYNTHDPLKKWEIEDEIEELKNRRVIEIEEIEKKKLGWRYDWIQERERREREKNKYRW